MKTTHVLEEDLEDTTGLLVDETGDTLDTATTGETTDSGLGDTLNVVAKNLTVTLGAALAETLGIRWSTIVLKSLSTKWRRRVPSTLQRQLTLPPFPRPDMFK